jgi:cyclopropane fatty-acyl-phospholipid synthase-like methyltransferase
MAVFPYFEILITYAEHVPTILTGTLVFTAIVRKPYRYVVMAAPALFILSCLFGLLIESRMLAKEDGHDMSLPSRREALETYIQSGEGDLHDIIEGGKYPPVFGFWELRRLVLNLLPMAFTHNVDTHNEADVPVAYNKGDDWFGATLGDPMVYTSGIYLGKNDDIWQGQVQKLNYILDSAMVKPGDKVLDIGCGWGRLLDWYARAGAHATGMTLSVDQAQFGRKLNAAHGDKVNIILDNFMTRDIPEKSFNVISAVEMAEHVGIRNYNTFLRRVHKILADDGTFYIQVAGLRRGYGAYNPFEEHTWGLFMDEHVFPGADASCPMGWVVTHLERSGFEVQRAQNLGWHYSKTLAHWLDVWTSKKAEIVKVYGDVQWRRWEVFLKWSVRIARRGESSVFMIVATKAGQENARIKSQEHLAMQMDFEKMGKSLGLPLEMTKKQIA